MTDIVITDLTEGTDAVTGTGVFDELMKAVVSHLQVEYKAKRISSDTYPQIYLGALQTAMTQAVTYLMQKPLIERQAATEESKQLLVARQTKGFDDDAKQKLLKQALDSWSVAYSVAQDANSIPDAIKVGPIDQIMKNAMAALAIIPTTPATFADGSVLDTNPLGEAGYVAPVDPAVTAIAVIVAYANDETNPAPTTSTYAYAGVTGVTSVNLAAVNAAVAVKIGTEVDTAAEIQALVV